MAYRVKKEYIDLFYGPCDVAYIEECQQHGVPQEDIDHMVREYGEGIMDELEEI